MEKEEHPIDQDQQTKKVQSSWRRVLCFTAIPFFFFLLLITPVYFSAQRAARLTKLTHNMKQFSIALLEYEHIHDKYPERLEDLVSHMTIQQETLDGFFYRHSHMTGVWWYNVGVSDFGTSAPPKAPHLVSPSIKGKRAVLHIDQSVIFMTDEEAMKFIADADSTWRPLWALIK